MPIITISRGTLSSGQKLAGCVYEKLGYRCLSSNLGYPIKDGDTGLLQRRAK